MPNEVKAAFTAVIGIILTLFYSALAFRVVVPSILEAHFEGSTMVAFLAAFVMLLGMALLVYAWVLVVVRLLRSPAKIDKEPPTNG